MASMPSMNLDVYASGSSLNTPQMRHTGTFHDQTGYGAIGPDLNPVQGAGGYIDIHANVNPDPSVSNCPSYQPPTDEFAQDMNLNGVCSSSASRSHSQESSQPSGSRGHSQESSQPSGSRGHSQESSQPSESRGHSQESFQPSGSRGHSQESSQPSGSRGHSQESSQPSGSRGHSQGYSQQTDTNQQNATPSACNDTAPSNEYWNLSGTPQRIDHNNLGAVNTPFISSTTPKQRIPAVATDSEPFEDPRDESVGGAYGGQSLQYEGCVLQGPPVTPKVDQKHNPFARKTSVEEKRPDDRHHRNINISTPDALTVTAGGGRVNINISNTNTVQIGNNNLMNVYQQPGGVNLVTVANTKPVQQPIKKKVTLEVAKRRVARSDMELVSDHLGRDWRRLGSKLDLTRGELEALDHDHCRDGLREIIYQMLLKWQSNSGGDSMLKNLVSALVSIKRPDIAKKFAD